MNSISAPTSPSNFFLLSSFFVVTFLLSAFASVTALSAGIDPLSKIHISSNNAQLHNKKNRSTDITYKGNVEVVLADNSKINSNTLFLTLLEVKDDTNSPQFEKIVFNGSINMVRDNINVKADVAEIYPDKKLCKLVGNVQVKQVKQKEKDIPITTEGNTASLNLETNEVIFCGNKREPVTTLINLEGHPILKKK